MRKLLLCWEVMSDTERTVPVSVLTSQSEACEHSWSVVNKNNHTTCVMSQPKLKSQHMSDFFSATTTALTTQQTTQQHRSCSLNTISTCTQRALDTWQTHRPPVPHIWRLQHRHEHSKRSHTHSHGQQCRVHVASWVHIFTHQSIMWLVYLPVSYLS